MKRKDKKLSCVGGNGLFRYNFTDYGIRSLFHSFLPVVAKTFLFNDETMVCQTGKRAFNEVMCYGSPAPGYNLA